MDVDYADNGLRKLCTDEKVMRRKRIDIEVKLKLRLNALRAAEKFGDLRSADPLGKWHPLGDEYPDQWAGELSRNWRLLVRPEGEEPEDERTEVTVLDIKDYH